MAIRRVTTTSQPQHVSGMAWDNPLTRDMVTAGGFFGGRAVDVLNGRVLTPAGGAGSAATARGMAATSAAGSGDLWSTSIPAKKFSDRNVSSAFVLAYSTVSNTTRKRALRVANSVSGTVLAIDLSNGSSAGYSVAVQVAGATFQEVNSGAFANTPNVIDGIAFTRSGTAMQVLVNGVDRSSVVNNTTTANHVADADQLFICNNASAAPLQGGVLMWAAWNRAISADEVRDISANPWQVFL